MSSKRERMCGGNTPSNTPTRNGENEEDDAEKLLQLINPPQLTIEEQLRNAQRILRELIEVHHIDEYASVVRLNLNCDGCHQPFIETDDDEDCDQFDNLTMCVGCIQLCKDALALKIEGDSKRQKK